MKVINLLNEIYLEKIKNKLSFIVKSKSTLFESPRIIYTIENNEIISLEGYDFFERLQRVYKLDDEIEIIEEEKEIEHYDYIDNPDVMDEKTIAHNFQKLNEDLDAIVRELNKIKKEGK